MQVVEKFVSINGEGPRAGELAVFIRFQGCNLMCSYCDTTYANEPDAPYEDMTPDEICAYVNETHVNNVTLTGGEPLLQGEMYDLIEKLLQSPHISVEIETNGAVPINGNISKRVSYTMDYKLPSSGMEDKMLTSNLEELRDNDTVKFVVGTKEDLDRAYDIIKRYNLIDRCYVYLSPVFGNIEPEVIVDYMKDNNLNGVRLGLQMHKVIWNPDRRGV